MANLLVECLKHPIRTSSIIPDSKALTRIMLEMADLPHAEVVIELGPGSGGATKQIMKELSLKAKYLAVEINPKFVKHIRKKCPDATIYCDDALNLKTYLKKHDINDCQAIISGLPLTVLKEGRLEKLLDLIMQSLSSGGRFVAYAYVHRVKSKGHQRLLDLLGKYFTKLERTRVVWKNLPPAYVYCATK
ncbi:MAG: rRNA adenine N-6-methyltransferase family protein [Candidatus Aminicenantes bacterium]|nr:rRNA adenine N-6-methyltransferase family protein [Candidatus Aminicenantes bacterium]